MGIARNICLILLLFLKAFLLPGQEVISLQPVFSESQIEPFE